VPKDTSASAPAKRSKPPANGDGLSLNFERVSTASRVAEVLREQLLSGVFRPGTPMRDVELSRRAGVARSTMREALTQLARDGLLEHSLHRGMEVTRLSQADVADIYEARRVLECAGVQALKAGGDGLEMLEAAIHDMHSAAQRADPRAMVDGDVAFHLALVAAAGSPRLSQCAESVMLELRLVLSVVDRNRSELLTQVKDHETLLAAIRSQPPARAVSAVEQHLVAARDRLASSLEGLEAPSPA
jgi:DNA-binding GntR family transcriptional regulator